MPYIQCTIHSGLSASQKGELALELAEAVHQSLGSPKPYIHVGVTEIPANEFVESGQIDFQYKTR